MPTFFFHFSDDCEPLPHDLGLQFADLEQAYLELCAAIPKMASELLVQRKNPLAASCRIASAHGQVLMTVPFTNVLKPSEWRLPKATQRPHGGPRSPHARDALALTSFRRMFSSVNAGCVLLTPDMHVVEMNDFGARHSHVDTETIRGASIFDIFSELRGQPKADFDKFMSLAQAGAASEVIDLPYLVLDAQGQTASGWWNAKTWPVFDDDDHLLGFVEWAEPHVAASRTGNTLVRVTNLPQRN